MLYKRHCKMCLSHGNDIVINMGYWPSVRSRWLDIGQVLFLRVCGPRRSRGPETRKKRTRPISSHLGRTSLVNKGFIIWLSGNFSCGTRRVVPSGQDSSTLPARVANHSAGFDSSCPLSVISITHCQHTCTSIISFILAYISRVLNTNKGFFCTKSSASVSKLWPL